MLYIMIFESIFVLLKKSQNKNRVKYDNRIYNGSI